MIIMNEKEVFKKLFNIINKYHDNNIFNNNVVNYKEQYKLVKLLNLDSKKASQNWDDVFYWIEQYLEYSVNTHNPQFINRMWAWATLPSQIWEIVTTITNTCSSTYESAPVSTLMEKYMIETMLDEVGFHKWEWQMTTGSSNANMIAMMIARNEKWNEIKEKWLQNQKKLIAFVNEEAHYSMDKSANILWIGTENLIKIPVLKNWEMNINILESEIENTIKNWNIPFFVSATAWTTVRWAYDNIEKILELKEKYKFWFHVDWAWWWVVFLNKKLRNKFLKWIEEVDSFTFDFHKMPWLALICNMFLINHNRNWKWYFWDNCCTWNTDYIFSGEDNNSNFTYNLWEHSLQCWKKVDSLKLFLEWKYSWKEWMSKKIENYYNLTKVAEEIIEKSPYLELVVSRVSFNLCFRFITPENIDKNKFNLELKNTINKSWEAMVWWANIKNNYIIRLLVCNEKLNKQEFDIFFNNIVKIWEKMLKK